MIDSTFLIPIASICLVYFAVNVWRGSSIFDAFSKTVFFAGFYILGMSLVDMFREDKKNSDSFIVPILNEVQSPLKFNIDFDDLDLKSIVNESIEIETKNAKIGFLNSTGSLNSYIQKRTMPDSSIKNLNVFIAEKDSYKDMAFLVALNDSTPLNYKLISNLEDENSYNVIYRSENIDSIIEKKFIISKNNSKIDCILSITPFEGKIVQPRIIWSSPALKSLSKDDVHSTFVISKSGELTQKLLNKLNVSECYRSVDIFGSHDKYFLISLINDSNNFVNRAYYGSCNQRIVSYLESNPIVKKTEWKLGFYVGAKDKELLNEVDSKLEKVLNFGFFSFLTNSLLYFLKLITTYTKNYGISIIIIAFLLQFVFFLVSGRKQHIEMQKVQDYQKRLEYLKMKFKDNPIVLRQEEAKLIQEHGLPGTGFCLVMLGQIPFMIALSSALNNSFELYNMPFVFWIKDLSESDPYYILPAIVFLCTILAKDPVKNEKQKIMKIGMAVLLFAVLSTISSGLGLSIVIGVIFRYFTDWLRKFEMFA